MTAISASRRMGIPPRAVVREGAGRFKVKLNRWSLLRSKANSRLTVALRRGSLSNLHPPALDSPPALKGKTPPARFNPSSTCRLVPSPPLFITVSSLLPSQP